MKVAILAGGKGSRMSNGVESPPKPMTQIGGRPVLWHIMKYCSYFGLSHFSLALGYKANLIKRYFLDYHRLTSQLTVSTRTGDVTTRGEIEEDWQVDLVDTGEDTETGGRLKRLAPWVADDTFMLTYADGLADIDLARLLEFHRSHGRMATVTAVRAPSQFGMLSMNGGPLVNSFVEKPVSGDSWINGGYFVLEPQVLDYVDGDAIRWEEGPLRQLASEGQLVAYRHESFWQCMDTLKEVKWLNELWEKDEAPWKVWK